MGYPCQTCGEVLPSHGSLGIHEYHHTVARDQESRPPPSLPTQVTSESRPASASGRPRRVRCVCALNLCVLAAAVGSLFVVDSRQATGPTELAAEAGAGAGDSSLSVPQGWTVVNRPGDGFSVAVPGTFETMPLTGAGIDGTAEALRPTRPAMAEALLRTRPLLEQARLFAVERHSGRNVTVLRVVTGTVGTIDDVPEGVAEAFGEIGAREERVELPAGAAIRISSVATAGSIRLRTIQHLLVHDEAAWMITYTDSAEADDGAAHAIASSFRFVD